MRRALFTLISPLRTAAARPFSSFRRSASSSLPRKFAPASAAAAAAAAAAFYLYSSRVETAQSPPSSPPDEDALEAAAAARAGTVVPGLPDFTLEQVSQHKTRRVMHATQTAKTKP
jgi:hypothetical protein